MFDTVGAVEPPPNERTAWVLKLARTAAALRPECTLRLRLPVPPNPFPHASQDHGHEVPVVDAAMHGREGAVSV